MAAVSQLATQSITGEEVDILLGENASVEVKAEWLFALSSLHAASALEHPSRREDIVVVPRSAEWYWLATTLPAEANLSRFASVRIEDGNFVVDSPFALAHVELRSLAAFTLFGEIATAGKISSKAPQELIEALQCAGLLSDADAARENWTVPDAAQHARSRIGHGPGPRGRIVRESVAQFKPGIQATIALPREPTSRDSSLDEVLSARRSLRANGTSPITIAQLSQLLFRSSREEQCILPDGTKSVARLYPSGGSCHSLDLYVAVAACEGLEPALYLYDRAGHSLGRVADASVARALVRDARTAAVQKGEGQALLILASDFDRVNSRYEGMAYSLILKEVGAALQTIHLVATAMKLAACPIGSGDSWLFARALGADFFKYTSVGELLIGSVTNHA